MASSSIAPPHPRDTQSLSPPPVPPKNSPIFHNSFANIKRSRSVHFSSINRPPLSKSSMSVPRTTTFDAYHQTESSADEVTPIIDRERGGGRAYSAMEPQTLRNRSEGSADRKETGAGPRRRRQNGNSSEVNNEIHDCDTGDRWWKGFLEKYGSVELDNKGSVARDHLALERTFLAWLRTSLAFASIGIAITQLFRLNTTITDREGLKPLPTPQGTIRLRQVGKPLGATFLGIAILVLAVGGRRYFESQYWIIRGKFPASRGSVFITTFAAVALIITSLVVVCTVDPTQFQQ